MLANFSPRQLVGLILGPFLFLLVLMLPTPEGLSPEGVRVGAVALLMACFWMAETVPIPVTATLPIFLFPLLKVMPTAAVTRSYGEEILFLFMGGFLIAIAMQRWQLHRRLALNVIHVVGSSQARLVLGFMLATSLLSMWISNSATAVMMLPVAIAVIEQTRKQQGLPELTEGEDYPFGTALMLAIAYSASIGGVATLVGTPPNAIFIGILNTLYGIEIGFLDWMKLGVPVSVAMLFLCWLLLTRVLFKLDRGNGQGTGAHDIIRAELDKLGRISSEERRVALVFACVASAWILRGLFKPEFLGSTADSSIAMTGAFMLFILPRGAGKPGRLLDWQTAAGIPWDIIVLMGGGFALAEGFASSGLTEWLANQLGIMHGFPTLLLILLVVLFVTFLTEMTSNAATATLFIPVMGALAVSMDLHPLTLMVPTAVAASMAFMLPVATPPNAIVFGSRMVTIQQMARTGIWLNLGGALVVSSLCYFLTDILL
jgi:solute carrier family 13 (sodium-dependent dicarboxylate transporter), member 2/3/5